MLAQPLRVSRKVEGMVAVLLCVFICPPTLEHFNVEHVINKQNRIQSSLKYHRGSSHNEGTLNRSVEN